MNGLITYGFGKIEHPGFIIIYGMGLRIDPFITLRFDLNIEKAINFSLVR